LLAGADWKPIVEGTEYLTDANDKLRSLLEDQCYTWLASLDARKHSGGVLAHSLIPLLIFTCKPCNGTK